MRLDVRSPFAVLACAAAVTAHGKPVPEPLEVEVNNFPDTQTISGSVSINDLVDVNVVNDQRIQVEARAQVPRFEQETARFFIAREGSGQFTRVPDGYKLVVTDFNLNHNVSGGSDSLGANIRRARADTNCSTGPFGTRVQYRVGPGPDTNVSLATGIEFYAGEQVCLGTGGSVIDDPDLELSYTIFGYLTPD